MRRSLIIIIAVAVLLIFGFIYYAIDPSASTVFPRCAFLSLTGYKCPGCGTQRAIHALMYGNVVEAFKFNALLLVSIPWIALCLYGETQRTRNPRLYARINAPLLMWIFLVLTVLWWLLRNIFNW